MFALCAFRSASWPIAKLADLGLLRGVWCFRLQRRQCSGMNDLRRLRGISIAHCFEWTWTSLCWITCSARLDIGTRYARLKFGSDASPASEKAAKSLSRQAPSKPSPLSMIFDQLNHLLPGLIQNFYIVTLLLCNETAVHRNMQLLEKIMQRSWWLKLRETFLLALYWFTFSKSVPAFFLLFPRRL